jgi:hypothetical protein
VYASVASTTTSTVASHPSEVLFRALRIEHGRIRHVTVRPHHQSRLAQLHPTRASLPLRQSPRSTMRCVLGCGPLSPSLIPHLDHALGTILYTLMDGDRHASLLMASKNRGRACFNNGQDPLMPHPPTASASLPCGRSHWQRIVTAINGSPASSWIAVLHRTGNARVSDWSRPTNCAVYVRGWGGEGAV